MIGIFVFLIPIVIAFIMLIFLKENEIDINTTGNYTLENLEDDLKKLKK